jgi:predicted CXXCH cytochrome family protein
VPPPSSGDTVAPAAQPPAPAARTGVRRAILAGAALATVLLLAGLWWLLQAPGTPEAAAPRAASAPATPAAFVDNRQCLECHAPQATLWRSSHHAMAMAAPTAETVRGDFNDTTFTHDGVTSRFFRRGDAYLVRTDGPDGRLADFEIAWTFGVAPLQQYLIALPGGRLQPLQIAWDSERRRWFHLLPHEKAPAGDVLHWTGRYQNANTMCISCHTTGFEKRYDAAADRFDSRWHEPNVSCQSCHGPGERHVRWALAPKAGRPEGGDRGLSVALKSATPQQQAAVCAACHSRRSELVATAVPGRTRLDQHQPALLTEGLYHVDGQQLDEVFVDGSFRQSRMYQAGVACTACHDPHAAKLKASGNAVCTQCHAPQPDPRYPKGAGLYDSPAHHFHPEGSPGASCANCHMPARTYMQIQPRRDHSLRIPRPDLSVRLGTPNACNACHADRSPQWAADQVVRWYGPARPPHYGEVLAAARAGRPDAGGPLGALVADTLVPSIVRATALSALRGYGDAAMAQRVSATRDADPEVRAAAADSLESAAPEQRLYTLGPLLTDPVLAVRIAAARSLSSLPAARIGPVLRPAFDAALAEYMAVQNLALDMPGARLNLATVHQNVGRLEEAERHYRQALAIDPDFTPARANLSRLLNRSGRNAEAVQVLTEGLARQPGIGELQYSLGLLLAEEGRLPEAAAALEQAATLMPGRARVQYNLGLALQQTGRRPEAERALLAARELAPDDPDPVRALAIFYTQAGRRAEALRWAERLEALAPGDVQARQLAAQLRGPMPVPAPR